MSLALVDRSPTHQEIQKLRLILSTFQDGTGQLALKGGATLPGWRDFERTVALAFDGEAQESKAIFDVLIPDPSRDGVQYGVSCKMRRTLSETIKTGRVTLELSNSSGKFWDELKAYGLDHENYRERPDLAGKAIINLVEQWHTAVSVDNGGTVDLNKSCYLVLSWNKAGWYQFFQFSLQLPDPETLYWHFPTKTEKGKQVPGRRLRGDDNNGNLFEWYGESGGQLKYYPLVDNAIWVSEQFQLEPLPESEMEYGILVKARTYFPQLWKEISGE
jgi:hypothetical protein